MLHADPLDLYSLGELVARLGLAAFIGLLLGLDREIRGHDAGIRTHALVALSSAMIMISSLLLFDQLRTPEHQPDPLRAVQGLSQAIGFIAAGIIFVRGSSVRNMTTAANIWIAAAIGIACGAGQYQLVLVGSGFALVLLSAIKLFERWLPAEKKDSDKPK
ncbi:MgtC/SapB family protein [Sphingosinicella rhizophila]|uniref:Protein MgtC n=1 Tax=Sphingosinicella rhizophila TaxID=3050082 RepID=A0ABU3Q8K8_9SPHN|nr:MgtC/SapB family protein [Sphingosinicella sp. GR2756]MDT9599434.1 MgtC/SapB family protein [Sphingosinicella sp. GR2756]